MLLLYLGAGVGFGFGWLIYIPLCFYFIFSESEKESCHISIYIPLCFYFIAVNPLSSVTVMIFTFHYASTLSRLISFFVVPQILFTFHYASTLSGCQGCNTGLDCLIYIPLCFYFIKSVLVRPAANISIYIPLCFYFICCHFSSRTEKSYLHSTMLLLYPVPLFPFYFLQYGDTFCLPPFCIALLSKIFLLPLYKIWIFLDISSFVYPTVFFLYLRSTIIKSCLFYHHPLPKIP